MSKTESTKSALVQSVLALDEQFAGLERLGEKIVSMSLNSESDQDQMRKLLARFSEYGQGVSTEVTKLSTSLNEARARAERVAAEVARRAEELSGMNATQQGVWDRFRALSAKVQILNQGISALKKPEDSEYTDEDRKQLTASLQEMDALFDPLIEESQNIRKEAQNLKIKTLESNADSLAQTLQSVRQKIRVLNSSASAH